jgi:hypothetical protein
MAPRSLSLKPMLKIAVAKAVPVPRGRSDETRREIALGETNEFDVRTAVR